MKGGTMATPKPKSVFTLPKEMVERLKAGGADIEKAEVALAALKKLGMDTKVIEEKLEWSKMARETLLSEFGE